MKLPKGFGPASSIPAAFLRVLMRRVEWELFTALRQQWIIRSTVSAPELLKLYLAFADLEAPVAKNHPSYLSSVLRAKEATYAALPEDDKRRLHVRALQTTEEAFDRLVEEAEKYPGLQDFYLVSAVQAGAGKVILDRLEKLTTKLNNRELRQPLLDYIYFVQARTLLVDGKWREASRLAANIEQPEARALLYLETGFSLSGKNADDAAEMLNLAALWAAKAKNSEVKAVLQFTIATHYARLDRQRAFDIAADAVATLNNLIEPDLSVTTFVQRLVAGGFETSLRYEFTSFNLEDLFLTLGELDAESARNLAGRMDDKLLHARAALTLTAGCLKQAERELEQEKEKEKKKKILAKTTSQ